MTRRVLCLMDNETTSISNCDGNNLPFASESCNTHSCVEDEVTPIDASHDIREDEEEEEECEDSEEDESGEEGVSGPTSPIVPPSWMSELLVRFRKDKMFYRKLKANT